jgi:hypothetical protein
MSFSHYFFSSNDLFFASLDFGCFPSCPFMELTVLLILLQVSTGTSSASVERSLVVLDQIPMHLMQNRRNTRTVVTIHKMGTEALWTMNSGMCSDGLVVRRPCLKVPCVPSVSPYQQTNLRYFCFVCETSNRFGW